MKNAKLKQALSYQLSDFAYNSLYVYGIALLVIAGLAIFATTSEGNIITNVGIGGVGFIHLLVLGIAGIRSDLRFFIQHGIGRRTTFFSNLYGSIICSIALGLFCEIVNVSVSLLPGFVVETEWLVQSFLISWLSHAVMFFFAWQIGALISLVYYRLSKTQQIVFTVLAIAALVLGVRVLGVLGVMIEHLTGAIQLDATVFVIPVYAPTLTMPVIVLIIAILAAVGNYLLIRRVQIKESVS